MRPSDIIASISSSRCTLLWTVAKFVSIPPSQRSVTYGMPQRVAYSLIATLACFLVPTKRTEPPLSDTSRTKAHAFCSARRVFCRSMM